MKKPKPEPVEAWYERVERIVSQNRIPYEAAIEIRRTLDQTYTETDGDLTIEEYDKLVLGIVKNAWLPPEIWLMFTRPVDN